MEQEKFEIEGKQCVDSPDETDRGRKCPSGTVNAGLSALSEDVIARYGSGIKEHLVAYTGIDRSIDELFHAGKNLDGYIGQSVKFTDCNGQAVSGQLNRVIDNNTVELRIRGNNKVLKVSRQNIQGIELKRGLKDIATSKLNPAFEKQNIKQQAGFSAEVKEVARQRAEQVIRGEKPTTVRTDDIPGHVNDPLFDVTSGVDANGNPIPGASAQMKFVGGSPKAAVEKMMSKGYQKYIDNDVRMIVPNDFYDGMKTDLQDRMQSLQKQIEYLKKNGSQEAIRIKESELQKCKILDKNLAKSTTSNSEALEARTAPTLSTTKDILRVAHRAGVEQAEMGAAIGGGISLVRNFLDVYNGKKSKEEAALSVAGDTTKAAIMSYAVASSGSAIKGAAQNSSYSILRNVSKTNLPAYIATSTLEITKTMHAYFSGEIDGVQCLEDLGEKGFGMVNSALYAAIGQIAIPIPILGALAGSMLGYALSAASYNALFSSLKQAKMAREERIRIECECAEAIAMLQQYRADLEKNIHEYLEKEQAFFDTTLEEITSTLSMNDVDGCIASMNKITKAMGKEPLCEHASDFDKIMKQDIVVI